MQLTQSAFTCAFTFSKVTIEKLEQVVKYFTVSNKDTRATLWCLSLWLTLTYFTPCSDVYNVNFEHVIAGWERALPYKKIQHRFNRYHDVIQCCWYVVSLMFFLFIIKFLTLSLLARGPQEVKFVGTPPQSLKVGPGTPRKFKSGTPGPPSKFKSRTPGPPSMFKSGTIIIFFLHCLTHFVLDKYIYNMEIIFHK